MENQWVIWLTFFVYLCGMLAIGLWSFLRTRNLSDYILGGRNLGPLPSALSAGASDMSGWLLLGMPGYAYIAGLEAVWIAIGLLIGTWLNWRIVASRLRIYSQVANNALTLPEYFEYRFQDNQRVLRVIAAFFILLFFLFYTSAGLVAGGKLFATVFGLNYNLAVMLGTIAVISYTLFGGFLAVAWTDVIQGLLMVAAIIVVPLVATNSMSDWSAVNAHIINQNPELLNIWTNVSGDTLGIIFIVSSLGWGLGYFGQPHILARFKAIRSTQDIPVARRIGVLWTGIGLLGALACGIVSIAFFDTPLDDSEKALMLLIDALFHPVVAGILLAAILAAIMSTADSQLLVSSSVLAEDFYKALFRQQASPRELINTGRLAVLLIAVIAMLLALNPDSQVLNLVSYAWAGFGAAFGPALILSLYWKRMTCNGALAGIIVGGMTVIVWKQLSGGIFELYEIIPAFILATIAIVVTSLYSAMPSDVIKQQFDQVMNGNIEPR